MKLFSALFGALLLTGKAVVADDGFTLWGWGVPAENSPNLKVFYADGEFYPPGY